MGTDKNIKLHIVTDIKHESNVRRGRVCICNDDVNK